MKRRVLGVRRVRSGGAGASEKRHFLQIERAQELLLELRTGKRATADHCEHVARVEWFQVLALNEKIDILEQYDRLCDSLN